MCEKMNLQELKNKWGKVACLINTRERPSELALLLQSLRTQTYNDFDVFILDDMSGTPLQSYHFFNCVINLLKMDNHEVFIERTEFPHGVSMARQRIVDSAMKESYRLFLRCDDDCIVEKDFLEKLIRGIEEGYDLMSGVTPPCTPAFIRNSDLMEIGNRVALDKGEFVLNMDDFGFRYTDNKIIPSHHFRSSLLSKREVHEKVKYWPSRLSKSGMREEEIFSFNAILNGFKIGNHLNAICWHLQTPSGGQRFADHNELMIFNEGILKEETRRLFEKYGDFIEDYNKRIGLKLEKPTEEEISNQYNFILK